MELLDCALIGVCVVIRSNTVCIIFNFHIIMENENTCSIFPENIDTVKCISISINHLITLYNIYLSYEDICCPPLLCDDKVNTRSNSVTIKF